MNIGCTDGTYEHPAPRDTSLRILPLPSYLHCAQRTGPLRSSGKRAWSSGLLRRQSRLLFDFDASIPERCAHRNRWFPTRARFAEVAKMRISCYSLAARREQFDLLYAEKGYPEWPGPRRSRLPRQPHGIPVK